MSEQMTRGELAIDNEPGSEGCFLFPDSRCVG